VQVKFSKGGKASAHTHPEERILNVLAGTIYVGTGTELTSGRSSR
jgi:quercetin dioxygenase-like cupin family protein